MIADAIREDKIESFHDPQHFNDDPLECSVDFDSFFSWFRNNPDQKTLLITLLDALDRKFPEHWQRIIDSDKPPQAQSPKEKMWEELLAYAEVYFQDPNATKPGFARESKTKNICRSYGLEVGSDISEDNIVRHLRNAGIKTKVGRPKNKK